MFLLIFFAEDFSKLSKRRQMEFMFDQNSNIKNTLSFSYVEFETGLIHST